MSKEYIERSKVIETIKDYGKGAIEGGQKMLDPVDDILLIQGAVNMIRAADVVEVVRCKDCKNYELMTCNNQHFCNRFGGYVTEEDFCSRVERKDGASGE